MNDTIPMIGYIILSIVRPYACENRTVNNTTIAVIGSIILSIVRPYACEYRTVNNTIAVIACLVQCGIRIILVKKMARRHTSIFTAYYNI